MIFFKAFFLSVLLFPFAALASGQHSHPSHKMLLFGQSQLFASHLVYKSPHNYQVILKIKLSDNAETAYRDSRAQHPTDLFLFTIDSFDISKIQEAEMLKGKITRTGADNSETVIVSDLVLLPPDFDIVYFDEVPLSLAPSSLHFDPSSGTDDNCGNHGPCPIGRTCTPTVTGCSGCVYTHSCQVIF